MNLVPKSRVSNVPNQAKVFIAFIFFGAVSFFLLKDILFSPGLILGNDWGLPLTPSQIKKTAEIYSSTWQFNSFLSTRNFNTSASSFFWAWEILSHIGLTGEHLCKLLLLSCFVLAGFSLFLFLRHIGLRFFPSLVGGVIYITTPIFFNYSIMGWTFVLLVSGLIPLACLFFIKAIKTDSWSSAIIVSFLFSIAFFQSQTILWFPLIFLLLGPLVIVDSKSLINFISKLLFIMFLFLMLNQASFLPLLMSPDTGVSGNNLVYSSVSLGTMAYFFPSNIIRMFGSLFNYQYESILERNRLSIFGFAYPLMAIGGLFSVRHKKFSLFFLSIIMVPFGMYLLHQHRWVLQYIPYSNIVRDFPRFSIFSAFGFSALAAICINEMSVSVSRRIRGLLLGSLCLWGISLFPWWTGQLTAWDKGVGPDNRLRTKIFPSEYSEVEKKFSNFKLVKKALYLPVGGHLKFTDTLKFIGDYKGAWDIFAAFSPLPGALTITDRRTLDPGFQEMILENLTRENIRKLVPALGHIVLRKNMLGGDTVGVFEFAQGAPVGWLAPYYSSDKIDVYNIRDFIPLVFISDELTFSSNALLSLRESINQIDFNPRHVIVQASAGDNLQRIRKITENLTLPKGKNAPLREMPGRNNDRLRGGVWNDVGGGLFNFAPLSPVVEFRRITPTKYRLRIHGAGPSFFLVFGEGYHSGWEMTPVKYTPGTNVGISPNDHKIMSGNEEEQASEKDLKGYVAKGWVLPPKNGSLDFVSKMFYGTIQNDNLPRGLFFESWLKKPLPSEYHFKINASINGWLVPPEGICGSLPGYCSKNNDGTYDMELLIEFKPQRYFYFGLGTSSIILLISLGAFWFLRKRERLISVDALRG